MTLDNITNITFQTNYVYSGDFKMSRCDENSKSQISHEANTFSRDEHSPD